MSNAQPFAFDSRRRRRTALLLALSCMVFAGAARPGLAANLNWINAAGGAATTAGNWSPAVVPGTGDAVGFGLGGGYTVTWQAPSDSLLAFAATAGRSRHNFLSPMRLAVNGYVNAESLTVLSGTIRGRAWMIGQSTPTNLHAGALVLIDARDSLSTSTFGHSTRARLNLTAGARFVSQGAIDMAFSAGSICTVTVTGFTGIPRSYSALNTLGTLGTPARGNVSVGVGGSAQLRLVNGGRSSIAGDLILARTVNGYGHVHLIRTPSGLANPSLIVRGETIIGVTDASLSSGSGKIEVTDGSATLQGPVRIHAGMIQVRNGSSLTAKSLEFEQAQSFGASFRVSGAGSVATIDSTITNETNLVGLINSGVSVDSGATLFVNGTGVSTIGPSAMLSIGRDSKLNAVGELAVRGGASFSDGTVTASRFRMRDTGADWCLLDLYGDTRIRARVLLDAGSHTWVNTGTSTLGDSLADDGFVSNAAMTVGDHTLVVYDRNGADLGSLYFSAGGVLRLPQGGTTGPGKVLYGAARIEGTHRNEGTVYAAGGAIQLAGTMTQDGGKTFGPGYVDVLSGARLRARDSVTAQIRLYGELETGERPARLFAGNGLSVNSPSASIRLRIGQPDTIVVSGGAALAGALNLRTWGPAPAVGSVYRVITATAGVTGTFSTVTVNGVPAAGLVTVTYEPDAVKVTVVGNITVSVDRAPVEPSGIRFAATGGVGTPALALELPAPATVRVAMFDVMGRQIAIVADGARLAGSHRLTVPATSVPNGVFFARAVVTTADGTRTLTTRFVRLR